MCHADQLVLARPCRPRWQLVNRAAVVFYVAGQIVSLGIACKPWRTRRVRWTVIAISPGTVIAAAVPIAIVRAAAIISRITITVVIRFVVIWAIAVTITVVGIVVGITRCPGIRVIGKSPIGPEADV